MGLRVPQNKIQEKKYTSGGEYVIEKTNEDYKGYYYEFNNALYIGESFNTTSLKLIPIQKRNELLGRGKSLATFSALSGITSQMLQSPLITSVISKGFSFDKVIKFFCKNKKTGIIKEVDEDTYKSLSGNPLYETTTVQFDPSPGYPGGIPQNLDKAEKEMPGVSTFIGVPIGKDDSIQSESQTTSPIQPQQFEIKSLPTPLPLTGSVTDTPKPQDIISIGPIIIGNISTPFYIPPAVPSAPVLENLFVTLRTNNSVTINATLVSTTNSTVNRKGTLYKIPSEPNIFSSALDTGDTALGAFSQSRTGLDPETLYQCGAYAMNNDGFTGSIGVSKNQTYFWTLSNPPTAQASNLVATTGSSTEIRLSWTSATFPGSGATDKRYILLSSIFPNIPNITNDNGTGITPDTNTTVVATLPSSSTNYTASGLTTNTTYTFKLIPYTSDDYHATNFETANYLTASAPITSSTLSTPPTCTADSYALGDPYIINVGGSDVLIGYVYYKDTCNIYVVGPDDLSAYDTTSGAPLDAAQWGCSGTMIMLTGGDTSIGGGEVNTTDIRTSGCPPTIYSPFAAQLCYDYVDNAGRLYTWNLPTTGDWAQIYAVKTQLSAAGANLTSTDYWSSNELGKSNAYTVNPQTGTQTSNLKTSIRSVRPVVKIPNP